VRLVAPNRAEAAGLVPGIDGDSLAAVTKRGRALLRRWRAAGVAVTLGRGGAVLVQGDGPPLVVPAGPAATGDPCGAGDAFAAAAARALAWGALPSEAVGSAVAAASAFVAAGGASTFDLAGPHVAADASAASAHDVVSRVRSRGGTVVATGGCFDLLHAGHVSLLAGARALGDCLVVCLNSDESVRRLKGPDRPVVGEADRAAVLLSLASVDAVAVFGEDTPERVVETLRPDVFVKGADYALEELPEAQVLERWGGQAVVLPYLTGHSTTRLLKEVHARATP
jgi:rfaE bifunctional protein nucleotidyltransferase chain/domain